MELSVFVEIEKPLDDVWKAIVDFKNCSNYIESIIKLEIIEEPKDTFIGFKWKETRVMFGKEATETMQKINFIKLELKAMDRFIYQDYLQKMQELKQS